MEQYNSLNLYISASIRNNWELEALTDFQGATHKFSDVARKIAKLHILFEKCGLQPGDKVALCGRNCAQWALAALASLSYGTVTVPILNEFTPETIHHLVNHSDAKLLFVDGTIWDKLDRESMPALNATLRIADFSVLLSRTDEFTAAHAEVDKLYADKYPNGLTPEDIKYFEDKPGDLALINYTSGSTGFSKGVMLTYGNLVSNLQFYIVGLSFLYPGDNLICMLPLAHMYGFMVEMMHGFIKGCHLYFITRTPSPKVILEAFAAVKPKLIVTVPLILEKIIKTKVFPVINKPVMKVLLHIPGVSNIILKKIKGQIVGAFGGNVLEIIIGGAGLSKDVEKFLRRIKFPYTVGYGMTECAPLITYAPWNVNRPGSCGRVVDRMALRIDSDDPAKTPGVLWVKGDNVMQGYYHNPEATEAVFDGDGWMNTGDICTIDKDGFLYIRGRDKNMILGPSGQNIYPEEIEAKLNNLPLVNESIVVDRKGKLVALIHPDLEAAKQQGMDRDAVEKAMKDNLVQLNTELPAYSKVSLTPEIYDEEFEKTPKRSIKRYLYK